MRIQEHTEPATEYRGAYRAKGWSGVAFRVDGWETEPLTVTLCPDCDYEQHEREHGGGVVLNHGSRRCDHADAYQCEDPAYERTGRLACHMVGDDSTHYFDPSELTQLRRSEYCGECGQIGCGCDTGDDSDE